MIDAEKATYNVTRMVELLGVSRSGYHAWWPARMRGPGSAQGGPDGEDQGGP